MTVVIGPQIFPEALLTVCSYTISSWSDVPPEERLDGLHLPTSIENMPYLCALIVEVECEDHEDLFRSTDQGAPCKKYSRKSNETTISSSVYPICRYFEIHPVPANVGFYCNMGEKDFYFQCTAGDLEEWPRGNFRHPHASFQATLAADSFPIGGGELKCNH